MEGGGRTGRVRWGWGGTPCIDDITNNSIVLSCSDHFPVTTRGRCVLCAEGAPAADGHTYQTMQLLLENTDVVELTDLNLETRDVILNLLNFVEMPLAIRRRNN